MVLSVLGDLFEDRFQFYGRPPFPGLFGETGIHHQPWHVEGPWGRLACDLMRAEARFAPFAQLRERHRVVEAAAEIDDPRLTGTGSLELFFQERQEIARVKTISALMSGAV